MIKHFSILFFLLFAHSVIAQYDVQTVGNPQIWNTTGLWIIQKENRDVKGSVYLFENWKTDGVISLNSENKDLLIKDLNYDALLHQFVAKISKDSLFVFDSSNLHDIRINNRQFKKFNLSNGSRHFELLAIGKGLQILKDNLKSIKVGKKNPLTMERSSDVYIDVSDYYVFQDQKLTKIKLTKNGISKIFNNHSRTIKDFISDHNLSLNDKGSMQKILNYYSTL